MAVDPEGREAVTEWRVLAEGRGCTLLDVHILTGRTHQIRVHMTSIGHPLLGDEVYGKRNIKEAGLGALPEGFYGQCLHAYRLCFAHPATDQWVETTAPLPAYFEAILDKLGSDQA